MAYSALSVACIPFIAGIRRHILMPAYPCPHGAFTCVLVLSRVQCTLSHRLHCICIRMHTLNCHHMPACAHAGVFLPTWSIRLRTCSYTCRQTHVHMERTSAYLFVHIFISPCFHPPCRHSRPACPCVLLAGHHSPTPVSLHLPPFLRFLLRCTCACRLSCRLCTPCLAQAREWCARWRAHDSALPVYAVIYTCRHILMPAYRCPHGAYACVLVLTK